jgi:hypothetical protein
MAKKCMSCGGSMNKMAKGGNTSFGMLSVKAGVDKNPKPTAADRIAGAKSPNPRLERLSNKIDKKTAAGKSVSKGLTKRYDKSVDKVIVSGMKKMAKGGMMKGTVGGPPKKPFAAGIPYFIGAGQTGPESMSIGGTIKKVNEIRKDALKVRRVSRMVVKAQNLKKAKSGKKAITDSAKATSPISTLKNMLYKKYKK